MTTENVAFYARLRDMQELQHKREQKRIDLQRKFDNYVSSDHRVSRIQASRLQSYWKKVCENERKSKARNEQLLRDFDRVEAHIATLSSRTQRLKLFKDQYEQQVEAMYPYWKEQMEIKKQIQMKQEHRPAQVLSSHMSSHEPYSGQFPGHSGTAVGTAQNGMNGAISNHPGQAMGTAQNGMNGAFSNHPGPQYPATSPHVHGYQHANTHSTPQSLTQPSPHPQEYLRMQGPSASMYHQPPSSASSTIPRSDLQNPQNVMMYGQEQNQAPAHRGASGGLPDGYLSHQPPGAMGVGQVPSGAGVSSHMQPQRTASVEHHERQPSGAVDAGRLPPGGVVGIHGRLEGYGQAEDTTDFSISSETPSSPSHQLRTGAGTAGGSQASQSYFRQELQSHEPGRRPEGTVSKETEMGGLQLQGKASSGSIPAPDQIPRRESTTVPSAGPVDKLSSAQTEPFSSGDEFDNHAGGRTDNALYSPEVPPSLPKYEEGGILSATEISNQVKETAPSRGVVPGMTNPQETSGSEEDSESDSEISLPLGNNDARDTRPELGPAVRPAVEAEQPAPKAAEPNAIPLVLNGFWLLLSAVEAEIDETDSLEGIYASLPCTKAIREEIVRTANSEKGFERLDPRAISMVILDELPLLVRQLPGSCLLSERLLLASSRTINEVSIRSHMYSSALSFWDHILRHMVFLVRRGVMEPEAVARKFAPLLVAADSKAVDKAINVMSDILLKAEEEEEEEVTFGDESSLTATSPMSPDNPAAASPIVPRRYEQENNHRDYPEVPPLSLGGMEGDTDDLVDTGRASTDSFFDNKPLTETDAYQRMMMGTQPEEAHSDDDSSGNDEDDSEDEIEKATRIQQDSPSSQQTKKKRNVLSSLGGSLGMSLEEGDKPGETGGGTRDLGNPLPSDRTDEVSSPEKSDLSPTPRDSGGGYVPTAMEQSMKSTGRTDTMNRSAAFWGNESDLDDESEISVPMGTGKVEEEKDDFDFYD